MAATQDSPDLRFELQLVVCSEGIRNHVQQRISNRPTGRQKRLLNMCAIVGILPRLSDQDLDSLLSRVEKTPHL